MSPRVRISADEARRLALGAQGLAEPPLEREPSGWDLRRVLRRVGLIQIDSVNILERAHYLPAFTRLGAYDKDAFDRLSHRAPRRLFEYWGHEASLIPVELHPPLRWRMARAEREAWAGMRQVHRDHPAILDRVIEELRERGPMTASELAAEEGHSPGPWWDWSKAKMAVEFLFWAGRVSSARRRRFERVYDLTERVIPARVLAAPTPEPEDAQRELLRIAARSLGVAAERDLRDYFRLRAPEAKARIAELVDAGELGEAEVEGWGGTKGYLWHKARIPRRVGARALVGPFDSLLWERSRLERVFGFPYRLEIYVPAPKRRFGYYVLPFLLGDRLVARVDLKADRPARTLRANAIHLEPDRPAETEVELANELERLAAWLGLEAVAAPSRPAVRA